MRAVWGVLAVLIVAATATVAVSIGVPSSATKLPGPVTVSAAATGGGSLSATSVGAGAEGAQGTSRSVEVVTPDRPVSSLPAPAGSDAREAEKPRAGPRSLTATSSTSPAADR